MKRRRSSESRHWLDTWSGRAAQPGRTRPLHNSDAGLPRKSAAAAAFDAVRPPLAWRRPLGRGSGGKCEDGRRGGDQLQRLFRLQTLQSGRAAGVFARAMYNGRGDGPNGVGPACKCLGILLERVCSPPDWEWAARQLLADCNFDRKEGMWILRMRRKV